MKIIDTYKLLTENKYTLFHGTNKTFDVFDIYKTNVENNWNGAGIYFTDSKNEATLFGNKLIVANVIINNPFDISDIQDPTINGSGLIRKFANTPTLKDELCSRTPYTFFELDELITDVFTKVKNSEIYTTEGNNDNFKHVWLNLNGEEYVLRNKTKEEYNNKKFIINTFISILINLQVDRLPLNPSQAISPIKFTEILMKLGYDSIKANNSTIDNGYEYVIFNEENISIN